MDSEDDFDTQDGMDESGEDDFCSGGDDEANAMAVYDDSNADGGDYGFMMDFNSVDSEDNIYYRYQQNYTAVSEADSRQCQDDDIMRVCTVLSISKVEAANILRYYNWQKALGDLQQMQTEHIVECRRVLKWTYAYGYYLPEHEPAKVQFVEYLQGEAESGLERLHQCVEEELKVYLNAEGPLKEFNEFCAKLTGLTSYFENLVRGLENGLSDVDSHGDCNGTGSSKNTGRSSEGRGEKARGLTSRSSVSTNLNDAGSWSCERCTIANLSSATTCHMCVQPR